MGGDFFVVRGREGEKNGVFGVASGEAIAAVQQERVPACRRVRFHSPMISGISMLRFSL